MDDAGLMVLYYMCKKEMNNWSVNLSLLWKNQTDEMGTKTKYVEDQSWTNKLGDC